MEQLSQEVANTSPTVSNSAPPVSGIRAVLSRYDSDGESFLSTDTVPLQNKGFSSSSSSASMTSSDSEKEEEVIQLNRNDEIGESFQDSMPEFSTPRIGVPIAKISVDDDDDIVEDESEGEGFSIDDSFDAPPKVQPLKGDGLDLEGDEDHFRTAVIGSRNPQGMNFDDLVTQTGKMLEGVEEGEEETDNFEDKVSDDPSLVKSEVAEESGVEFTSEGDAIVDTIKVDPVEAVRSGVAVVGEALENEDSEEKVLQNSDVEERTLTDSNDVEVIHNNPANDSDSAVGSTDVDDTGASETSALRKAEVDVTDDIEAASGVAKGAEEAQESETASAVAKEAEEAQESETRFDDATIPEKPDSGNADVAVLDGAKFTSQGDSVVDKINVDVVEAVRSGAIVVGEHEESKAVEAKENGSAVEESIGSGQEFYKNEFDTEAKENGSAVEHTIGEGEESYKNEFDGPTDGVVSQGKISGSVDTEIKENGSAADQTIDAEENNSSSVDTEAKENGSAVDESIDGGQESYKHYFDPMDGAANQENNSVLVDNLSTANTSAVPEESLKDDNVDLVSDRDGEKVREVQATIDSIKPNNVDDKLRVSESAEIAEGEEDDKPETDEEDLNGSTDGENDGLVFGSSAAARQFMEELERASGAGGSQASAGISNDHNQEIDGQIVTDSEDEADSDNEQDGQELFDSAALAALLKAATNASGDSNNLTITSPDGTRLFSVERPAGLGSSLRAVRPSARPTPSMFANPGATAVSEESLSEEEIKKLNKLQQLRVKFLRLVYKLGHSAEDSIATQVLYRLALVAGRPSVPSFSLDTAKQTALKLEEEAADLDFNLNILVLGKSGVGKSATINSIFGEEKVKINAFEPGTTTVSEITGVVSGVNVRVFDTPGLRSSALEQGFNRKVLASVKRCTKKSPPDIVLYVDRLDSQTKDLNDMPMLKTITSSLGSSIWKNAIVTLTHAACAPPDGPSGSPVNYEAFVAQRSLIVQQYIVQAAGDFRLMSPGMMCPVSLAENHLNCRTNRAGEKVLPNGQTWKPQLMLLCFSMKILSDATAISKASSDSQDQRKLFGFRVRSPPLPYLLSSLLQPRAHPKLSADQGGDNGDSDIELDDLSDLEREEEEDEYDQLPPFKPLRKAQISRLSKEQKKAYFEEYDYRVKLLQKKQWKEELKRMKDAKKRGGAATDMDEYGQRPEDYDPENETPAAVPVALPDMTLPATFDGDNPAYRYRFLEPTSQFLARPVLDTHGWDHDCGYDGVNIEQNLGIAGRFPAAVTVQVTKDKKDFNLHLDSSVAAKHGENGSSLVGFDIQNIGKQMGYIVRGETKFKNLKKNKTAAAVSVTFLGENVATGVKVEDQITVGKRLVFVGSTGTIRSQKDAAYGANLEVRLREADYPIGQDQSSFVLSLMKWRGDLALGANLQSQVSVGRNSKMSVRLALNNKLSGQITVRTSSSDHMQIALAGLIPIAISIFRSFRPAAGETYPAY